MVVEEIPICFSLKTGAKLLEPVCLAAFRLATQQVVVQVLRRAESFNQRLGLIASEIIIIKRVYLYVLINKTQRA